MGGLTVLAALRRVLPEEQFIYLGDSARLPYGTKSPRTVTRYARQATGLLVERGIKALVVACNTASAFALAKLAADYDPLPVFGVLEPGAAAASAATAQGPILVLATESTIRGGGYQRALLTLRPEIAIYGRACPLWVTLAEQDHPNQALVDRILLDALRGFPGVGDPAGITVLLGCTHFPVFRQRLHHLVGANAKIIDSAATTARAVAQALADAGLSASDTAPAARGVVQYLATDSVQRFQRVGRLFLGEVLDQVELIDL